MAIINTNLASLTASRSLQEAQKLQETSMERLSTGKRINSAADDATGLAIAQGMTSQIRGLNMAINNAGAAVNLVDTADSALGETADILQRMRELSVQAGNSTLSATDRASLKVEMEALTAELDRIAATTSYNKNTLLDGSAANMSFQVGDGTSQSETVGLTIASATSSALGIAGSTTTSTTNAGSITGAEANAGAALSAGSLAVDDIFINGKNWALNLTSYVSLGGDGSQTLVTYAVETAAGLATAINTNTEAHGVTATAKTVMVGEATDGITSSDSMIMQITDLQGSETLHTLAGTNSLDDMITQINQGGSNTAQTVYGHIEATKNDKGGITITSNDGVTIKFTAAQADSGFASNQIELGKLTLTSADGSPVTVTRGDNATAKDGDLRVLGFNLTETSSVLKGNQVLQDSTDKLSLSTADDLTINGVQVGATDSSILAAAIDAGDVATAINAVSDRTNVTASAETVVIVNLTMGAGQTAGSTSASAAQIYLNGVTSSTLSANQTTSEMVSVINSLSASMSMGIVATLNSATSIKLTDSSGGNITLFDNATVIDSVQHDDGSFVTIEGSASTQVGASAHTFGGRLTLTNTAGGSVDLGYDSVNEATAQVDFDKLGLRVGTSAVTTTTTSSAIDVSSVAAATSALTAIDSAIQKVSEIRGGLGALSNRLDHTISNLTESVQNHESSRSQIVDADFAAESAMLAKAQVLSQASTAMLAQANAAPQLVLQLLQ